MDIATIAVAGRTEADIAFEGFSCKVFFEREPFGGYTVKIPAIPSFTCYGETLEKAQERFQDAFDTLLATLERTGAPLELEGEYVCYDSG